MHALLLLFALNAQAAPIHKINLKEQRYVSSPTEITQALEKRLAQHILETCGGGSEADGLIHKLDIKVHNLGGTMYPMHTKVTSEPELLIMVNDYPGGELNAAFECL